MRVTLRIRSKVFSTKEQEEDFPRKGGDYDEND